MFKTLADLDKFLNEEFEKYGLNTFLDVDNLDYSLAKSRELKMISWLPGFLKLLRSARN